MKIKCIGFKRYLRYLIEIEIDIAKEIKLPLIYEIIKELLHWIINNNIKLPA